MKNNGLLYNIFIIGFIVLYIATALISLCHAIEFFCIGNAKWMAITLASVFELGQMVVLSSLLLSENKKTLIPWLLLGILTCVQVIGNVFSVFKYISISDSDYYIYLQKSLINWWLSGVSQETIVVIVSWIIGALLPIIALFMTSMVANNIKLKRDADNCSVQEDKKEEVKLEEKSENQLKESEKEIEHDDIEIEEKSNSVEDDEVKDEFYEEPDDEIKIQEENEIIKEEEIPDSNNNDINNQSDEKDEIKVEEKEEKDKKPVYRGLFSADTLVSI